MGDILRDTTPSFAGTEAFSVELSSDWAHYFGMLGGYIVACAARAAIECCDKSMRMRSVHAIFTGPAVPGSAQGHCAVIHRGRSFSAVRTAVQQQGKRIIDATVAFSVGAAEAPEFDHQTAPIAELAFHDSSPSHSQTDSLWTESLEGRVCSSRRGDQQSAMLPERREWLRFRSLDGFRDDPVLSSELACLIVSDILGFLAAANKFDTEQWIAPSIDLSVFFHGPLAADGMYLCEAFGRSAHSGNLITESRVWSLDARLLATAFQTQLFRERR